MRRRSSLNRIGKKGRAWIYARKGLKEEFAAKGLTRCELCGSDYILSFHHRHKRRACDQHIFKNVLLLCAKCHQNLEYSRLLTKLAFKKLRDRKLTIDN